MIRADIAEIEKLTDAVVRAASDADEVRNRLRNLSAEMHDDIELAAYPQAPAALEALSLSMDVLTRSTDTLQSLRSVLLPLADTYRQTEEQHRNALGRMNAVMGTISAGYNAALESPKVAQVEHEDPVTSQSQVEELVANSALQMQAVNIAAVTKEVREEYDVDSVEPMTAEP